MTQVIYTLSRNYDVFGDYIGLCPAGLEVNIRLRALNAKVWARKGTNLLFRLIALIRMLPSKQNFMKLVSPDPKSIEGVKQQ